MASEDQTSTPLGETMNPTMQRHMRRERLGQEVRAAMEMAPVDGLSCHYTGLADDSSQAPKAREAALLFSAGEEQLNDEEADEALKSATQALEAFKEASDKTGEADALRLVVNCHRAKELYDEATEKANTEIARFKDEGNKRGEASMMLSLAEIQLTRDQVAGYVSLPVLLWITIFALELFFLSARRVAQRWAMLRISSGQVTRLVEQRQQLHKLLASLHSPVVDMPAVPWGGPVANCFPHRKADWQETLATCDDLSFSVFERTVPHSAQGDQEDCTPLLC